MALKGLRVDAVEMRSYRYQRYPRAGRGISLAPEPHPRVALRQKEPPRILPSREEYIRGAGAELQPGPREKEPRRYPPSREGYIAGTPTAFGGSLIAVNAGVM